MAGKLNFDIEKYYKNGSICEKNVKKLRGYLKTENLPYQNENILGVSLALCRGNLEKAKTLTKTQYLLKNAVPEAFDNRILDCEEMREQWKIIKMMVAPQLYDGTVVVVMGLRGHKVYQFNQEAAMKLFCMTLDSAFYDQPITGYRVLIDLENFSPLLLTKMNLNIIRRLFRFAGNSMNDYIKCVHFVNGGFVMNQLYRVIKMFVTSQMLNLFYCHDNGMDWDQFYENHISKDDLPSEYGGSLGPLDDNQKKLWDKLESMTEFFANEEKQRKMYLIEED